MIMILLILVACMFGTIMYDAEYEDDKKELRYIKQCKIPKLTKITIAGIVLLIIAEIWIGVSIQKTVYRPTNSIARTVVTTKIHYMGDPNKVIAPTDKTVKNNNNLANHYNTSTFYRHSLPNAHKHGIYLVTKQYHYVYRNRFDKKYLNNYSSYENQQYNKIGKNRPPYKIKKYYYIPKDIKTIQNDR